MKKIMELDSNENERYLECDVCTSPEDVKKLRLGMVSDSGIPMYQNIKICKRCRCELWKMLEHELS